MDTLSGNFVLAAATVINFVLDAYFWIIIIASVISWVNPDPYNPIVRFLYRVTDPVLRPIRRMIGGRLGAIDISPMIVLLAIIFLQRFFVATLFDIGYKLK